MYYTTQPGMTFKENSIWKSASLSIQRKNGVGDSVFELSYRSPKINMPYVFTWGQELSVQPQHLCFLLEDGSFVISGIEPSSQEEEF